MAKAVRGGYDGKGVRVVSDLAQLVDWLENLDAFGGHLLLEAKVPFVGAFTGADTVATARVLAAFSCGVPAYVLIKVLTPGFYARADTKTPVRIGVMSMVANMVCNLIFIFPLGYVGLALSTACSGTLNAALLFKASPILIASGHAPPADFPADVLLNLTDAYPAGFERFERVIEVVTLDEADRQRARERWKHYKAAGCEPLRHDLKIAGSAS